jgi:hypothetical protein
LLALGQALDCSGQKKPPPQAAGKYARLLLNISKKLPAARVLGFSPVKHPFKQYKLLIFIYLSKKP